MNNQQEETLGSARWATYSPVLAAVNGCLKMSMVNSMNDEIVNKEIALRRRKAVAVLEMTEEAKGLVYPFAIDGRGTEDTRLSQSAVPSPKYIITA